MTDITPDKLNQAREWAENLRNAEHPRLIALAAAEVIRSLPDSWIDADKLREALDWRDSKPSGDDYDEEFYDRLRALFPTPTPRTLADMTPEEREACQWMQADHDRWGRGVIHFASEFHVGVIFPDGEVTVATHPKELAQVTPLPDLPRMVWPDEHHPATDEDMSNLSTEIDTSDGHVETVDTSHPEPSSIDASATINDGNIDTPPTIEAPHPEDAPDGYWLIRWWGEEHPVPAEKVEGQWWVIGRNTMLDAKDVLIVYRLVPEVKA